MTTIQKWMFGPSLAGLAKLPGKNPKNYEFWEFCFVYFLITFALRLRLAVLPLLKISNSLSPCNLKLRTLPQDSPGPVSTPRAQRSMQEQDQDERVHERLGDEIDHASEPLRLREDEEGEAAVKLNIGG